MWLHHTWYPGIWRINKWIRRASCGFAVMPRKLSEIMAGTVLEYLYDKLNQEEMSYSSQQNIFCCSPCKFKISLTWNNSCEHLGFHVFDQWNVIVCACFVKSADFDLPRVVSSWVLWDPCVTSHRKGTALFLLPGWICFFQILRDLPGPLGITVQIHNE